MSKALEENASVKSMGLKRRGRNCLKISDKSLKISQRTSTEMMPLTMLILPNQFVEKKYQQFFVTKNQDRLGFSTSIQSENSSDQGV